MNAFPTRLADAPRETRPTAQVLALADLPAAAPASPAQAPVVESLHPLHRVPARLTVCVGEVTLTIGELLGAVESQVIVLDRAVDQPVDILLEGRLVARGELVAVDDRFGVRITEVPAPLA